MVASMANKKLTSMTPVTARLRLDPAPAKNPRGLFTWVGAGECKSSFCFIVIVERVNEDGQANLAAAMMPRRSSAGAFSVARAGSHFRLRCERAVMQRFAATSACLRPSYGWRVSQPFRDPQEIFNSFSSREARRAFDE